MNTHINNYNHRNEHKLRAMSKNKPKDYWKFLNSLKEKSKEKSPPISDLYDYFKTVNSSTEDEIFDENLINNSDQNDILNSEITIDEIDKMISKANNSKTPANDHILNE